MARKGRRKARRTPADPTLTATFELSLDNTLCSPEKFSAEAVSADQRRLYRDPVFLQSSEQFHAAPLPDEETLLPQFNDYFSSSDRLWAEGDRIDSFFTQASQDADEGEGISPAEDCATRYMASVSIIRHLGFIAC